MEQLNPGYYTSAARAVRDAAVLTPAWRFFKEGRPCSIIDLMQWATKYDKEHPHQEGDPAIFYVTIEGAIGYSATGHEYEMTWLFYPLKSGPELEAVQKQVDEEFARAVAAAAKTPDPLGSDAPTLPGGPSVIPSEAEESPTPRPRFCPQCGTPIKNPNAKFCPGCGQKLN